MTYPSGPWIPDPEALPAELRAAERWVRWKLVEDPKAPKPRKVPILVDSDACAKSNDPSTWGAFDVAIANAGKAPSVGVGFMLGRNGSRGYVGIDLDHVRDVETGELAPEAAEIIRRCGTYAEVSPSGRGVKLIGFVPIDATPELPRKKSDLDDGGELEVYASGRYFTATGERIEEAPAELGNVSDGLRWVVSRYLGRKATEPAVEPEPDDVDAPEGIVRRAAAYLRKCEPAVSGQRGHDATWTAALAVVRGFRLSTRQAIELLSREFNPRCSPPWSERDLARKVREVRSKASVPWGYLAGPAQEPAAAPLPRLRSLIEAIREIKPRAPRSVGVAALDDLLGGGLGEGEAIGLGGGPGAFKTSLACSIVEAQAAPDTAVLVVAHDEDDRRVARKIGAQFGESWGELTSEYPSVLERLGEKLATRGAEVFVTRQAGGGTLEELVEEFERSISPGRRKVIVVDHLQSVCSSTWEDRDGELVQIEKVVRFLIDDLKSKKNYAVVALSEVTKAALNPEAMKAAPLAAFAGTRKVASRFDVPLVLVPDGERRVLVIAAKNRFGRRGDVLLEVDPDRWRFVSLDMAVEARVQADAKAEEARRRQEEDDRVALERISRQPLPAKSLESELLAAGVPSRRRAREARDRLIAADLVEVVTGERTSSRGPGPAIYRVRGAA